MHKFNVICYTGADSIAVCGVVSSSGDAALKKGKDILCKNLKIKAEEFLFRVFEVKTNDS